MTILEPSPSFTPPTGTYSGILPNMTIPITEEDLAEANKWFAEIFRKNSKFTNIHLAMVLANYRAEKKAPLTASQENDDVMLTQEDQQEIGSEEPVLMTNLDRQRLFRSGIRSEHNRVAKLADPDCDLCRNTREVVDQDLRGYHEKAPCPKCRDGSWAYRAMSIWFEKYHNLAKAIKNVTQGV